MVSPPQAVTPGPGAIAAPPVGPRSACALIGAGGSARCICTGPDLSTAHPAPRRRAACASPGGIDGRPCERGCGCSRRVMARGARAVKPALCSWVYTVIPGSRPARRKSLGQMRGRADRPADLLISPTNQRGKAPAVRPAGGGFGGRLHGILAAKGEEDRESEAMPRSTSSARPGSGRRCCATRAASAWRSSSRKRRRWADFEVSSRSGRRRPGWPP